MARQHHENFPVASFLLPARARRQIVALYRFARGADDLADDPAIPSEQRLKALECLDAALQGQTQEVPEWAESYLSLCRKGQCHAQDGRDLLYAFMSDQRHTRCASWQEMLDYCRYSAIPVGRSFLELCGEKEADAAALEALCICLQLVNHLQDIASDYIMLGRIYLPADWLLEAGVEAEQLGASGASMDLMRVIRRVLTQMEPLLAEAERLPASVRSRRIALELRWVLAVVRHLHRRLREEDPLAARVAPGWKGKLEALFSVVLPPARPRLRSNFFWPMQMTGGGQKAALMALHRFLRAVDNAADETMDSQAALMVWREECARIRCGEAVTKEGRELLPFIARYRLDVCQLEEVVAGCAMDAEGVMTLPDPQRFAQYCERVAVAPGRLVLTILGVGGAQAEALAQALGHAFQRTNMLRDRLEDAARGRHYVSPSELKEFTAVTERYYLQAAALLAEMPRCPLMTVRLMRDVYWRLFCRVTTGCRTIPFMHHLPVLPYLLWRQVRYGLGFRA